MKFRILMAILFGAALLIAGPSYKSIAQDKKGTCEFGADDQKLKGAERKKFTSALHGQRRRARQEAEEKAQEKSRELTLRRFRASAK